MNLKSVQMVRYIDRFTSRHNHIWNIAHVPTEVPFDFQIVSNSGEELSVEFILKIANSSMDVPVILLPRPNEIFQFKESIISFAVIIWNQSAWLISSPPWVFLKGDKLNEYELHFLL